MNNPPCFLATGSWSQALVNRIADFLIDDKMPVCDAYTEAKQLVSDISNGRVHPPVRVQCRHGATRSMILDW